MAAVSPAAWSASSGLVCVVVISGQRPAASPRFGLGGISLSRPATRAARDRPDRRDLPRRAVTDQWPDRVGAA